MAHSAKITALADGLVQSVTGLKQEVKLPIILAISFRIANHMSSKTAEPSSSAGTMLSEALKHSSMLEPINSTCNLGSKGLRRSSESSTMSL